MKLAKRVEDITDKSHILKSISGKVISSQAFNQPENNEIEVILHTNIPEKSDVKFSLYTAPYIPLVDDLVKFHYLDKDIVPEGITPGAYEVYSIKNSIKSVKFRWSNFPYEFVD